MHAEPVAAVQGTTLKASAVRAATASAGFARLAGVAGSRVNDEKICAKPISTKLSDEKVSVVT
ncbi:MAG: hypothetical protein EBT81_11210 [Gammaproteobacteria bacterium]|nr:hypothetical protein [Gammaproteobacteria bacterium]